MVARGATGLNRLTKLKLSELLPPCGMQADFCDINDFKPQRGELLIEKTKTHLKNPVGVTCCDYLFSGI